jgi:hypothetical protein
LAAPALFGAFFVVGACSEEVRYTYGRQIDDRNAYETTPQKGICPMGLRFSLVWLEIQLRLVVQRGLKKLVAFWRAVL